ncbi:MAG TPA: DUF6543 domain-containing protein [Pseudomonas sp.]|nr:DUF6543 domain-containing protein [Pseudomonas sp.]
MQTSTGQPPVVTSQDGPAPLNPASHYEPLSNAIPDWLGKASSTRRKALKNNRRPVTDRIKAAPRAQHDKLRAAIATHMTAQNTVDQTLERLQDANAFAIPLLTKALKKRFGVDLEVAQTFLRLYIPMTTITTGTRTWTVSLVEAALHNFEEKETREDAYETGSSFITKPSPTGQFETLAQVNAKISIPAFTRLCRELDIGARYKIYLEDSLGITRPAVAAVLRPNVKESQKAALKAALQLARMNRDIGEDYLRLIGGLLDGLQGMRVNGQPLLCHDLTMMSAPLTGIVVFAPDLEQAGASARAVAYVPDDPDHPVKEYASPTEMMKELTRQLRSTDYQRFFSRFVAHEHRGYFFSDLNRRLSRVTWHKPQAGSQLPAWRDTPIDKPELQFAVTPITTELWEHLYQRKLNKILNDAAVIAVPTATVDRNARWALWDSFVKIASSIVEIASFIVLPFVPFLGEMMMAYMAYQFLDEVFESVVDWAQGQMTEAGEQFFAALESLVQLGAFGGGTAIAMQELPKVLPASVVSFIDRFHAVKLRNGKTLYWKPDLKAYARQAVPPKGSTPDHQGVHWHQGKRLVPIDQTHYAVSQHEHPGKFRIEHPTRPDAYQPIVRHNGEGAFYTELEQPLEWDTATALRRIGHGMEPFSPARRERILKVSGYPEDALRKMHVNQERVPPLLADSIQRFKIDQDLHDFIHQIASDRPEDYLKADPLTQLRLLKEHSLWPRDKRLRWVNDQGGTVWESSTEQHLPLTEIRQDRLIGGDLLKTLLQTLSHSEINTLLEEDFGQMFALDVRTRRLRARLAQIARQRRTSLFEQRYQTLQQRAEPLARKVALHEPHLPARITEELLNTATGSELLMIGKGEWPERQQELAQLARQELRIARAYEGLELDSVRNPDSDTLALHSLQQLPGWSKEVRLEVRDQSFEGKVLDSTGPVNASVQKVLVRKSDDTWQPYDHQGLELHAPTDFYTSVLQALPDAERQALAIQIGEGEKLKQAIRDNPLARSDLRVAIWHEPAPTPVVDTLRLVGTDGYSRTVGQEPRTLESRIRHVFPRIPDDDLLAMAQHLQNHPDGPIAALSRLRLEYAQLDNDLNQWMVNVPQVDPATGLRLSRERQAAALRDRQSFADALRSCWRRETRGPYGYRLHAPEPIMGDLPVLTADFSHVASLEISGSATPAGVDAFIEHFPGLLRLDLRHFDLHNLPQRITQMPSLRQLKLRNCGVVLTPQNQALLSSLNELTALDLQGNPLGVTFDVNFMPALTHINLSGTGISETPAGLLDHPGIRSAWLANNQFTSLPEALFELSPGTNAGFDFSGNPLSAATRERVKTYFNQTGNDLGVRAEQSDIDRTKALFTDLNDRQASELVYQLPGSLLQGRLQLARWETEIARMSADLAGWVRDIPDRNPANGRMLTPNEQFDEFYARETFAGRLERLWRHRSTAYPLTRADVFTAEATFMGDMPVLTADFSHITTLSLTGNKNISATSPFLRSFPRLGRLILHNFALDQVPQTLIRLPKLETLVLKDCGVTFTAEMQAALAAMPELELLELPNNPLGSAPDVRAFPELTYLDLSHTGIFEIPPGMLEHPKLKTAFVSDNRITELPDALFQLPAQTSEGFDFSNNPLSANIRERIKTYSRETSQDFGVLADQADIDATKALFPSLDNEEASDVFYGLPGNLEHGRSQLRHWQTEIKQLTADLAQWKTAIPETHPSSGQPLSPRQLVAEHTARTTFADQLEQLWRARSAEDPRHRGDVLISNLSFIGELPALSADFSHVSDVTFNGNAALSDIDTFLDSFSGLHHLELHDFNLRQLPQASTRMPSLERLIVENCALRLTPETQTTLSSLDRLQYLNLSHNPLGAPPTLEALPALILLRMVDTGISDLPSGLFGHPRLVAGIFDNNRIGELPDDLFNLSALSPRQFSFTDNPLTPATRDRIKTHYQRNRQNFGVSMPQEDMDRTIALFPSLDAEDANRVLYLLPGTIEQGRGRIAQWEAQYRQLGEDLAQWVTQIPERHPSTDEPLGEHEKAVERAARDAFRQSMEAFWQQRSLEQPESRSSDLELNLAFIGELPALSTDFGHVSALSLTGNPQLRVNNGFLQCFTGLDTLELRDLALEQVPQAIARMPALEQLVLSNCGVVLNEEGSAALSSLKNMKRLDLYANPLGMTPDIQNMSKLQFIDLASTEISEFPAGLLKLPELETVILNSNWITELPREIFNLPVASGKGYDLGGNPLSAATRERIKTYYLRTGEDLGVLADHTDIARVRTLYPGLDDEGASQFIYRLDGTLTEGRNELARREAELQTLIRDLDAWTADIPVNNPATLVPLSADQRLQEEQNRNAFKEALFRCWRNIPVEGSEVENHGLTSRLSIMGVLPTVNADFSHVPHLFLLGQRAHSPRIGRFLEAFPSLESLDIRGYDLGGIPEAVFRMGRLTALSLPDCNITLEPHTANELAGMQNLEILHLHDNPLALAPDLSNLQSLTDLDLSNTGITEIPDGVLGNFQWNEIDLSGNAITEVPEELMEVPAEIGDRYDLHGNPFSAQSMERIRAYYHETGQTLNVDNVIGQPPAAIRPDVDIED